MNIFSRSFIASASFAIMLAGCGGNETDIANGSAAGDPLPIVQPAANQKWSDTISQTEGGGYVMGNPDAAIKLVEFASLTCSACASFSAQAGDTLRDQYVNSGRVSFELRNYLRDPIDLTGAMLTRCGAESSFFPLSKQVFANFQSFFPKDEAAGQLLQQILERAPESDRYVLIAQNVGLTDFFAQRGLSKAQANDCLSNIENATRLADFTKSYNEQYNIAGTPTFLINGQIVDINTWDDIESRLQQMGARDK